MFNVITSNLLWKESPLIAVTMLALAVAGYFIYIPLSVLAVILFIFCFYFFRNPERVCPDALHDPSIIISPADGKIVDIASITDSDRYQQKISIFLSPLDVHVNWTPIAGKVAKVAYKPGLFLPAFLPKSSEMNEHNDVEIIDAHNRTLLIRQIAGTVARRIVCWIKQGDTVAAGQKYGMIKFSSRIDIFFSSQVKIEVKIGQKVIGGSTVIGRFS